MIGKRARLIAAAAALLSSLCAAGSATALPLAGAGLAKDTAAVTKAYYRGGHYGGYRGWGGYGFYRPYYRPYYESYAPYYWYTAPPAYYYASRPRTYGYSSGVRHCLERFRSFNPRTGTYVTYSGEVRRCPYLY